MDLLIQVEGTLSHLFDREISLDWDSGRLVPKARRRGNNALYRLDREEVPRNQRNAGALDPPL